MTVHKTQKRLTALLLALCMVLGLAACGGGKKEGGEQLSGTVYVPQFVNLTMDIGDVMGGCSDGESFFILASIVDSEEEMTETDPETGETYTYTSYESHNAIVRLPLDGGAAEELPNFEVTEIEEDAEGGSSLQSIRPGADGTLWVEEYTYVYHFDLPEGFDGDDNDKWEYFSDTEDVQIFRQIDATGNEISRIQVGGADLMEKLEAEYTGSFSFDNDGRIFVTADDNKLCVLDKDQNLLFTLEGERLWGDMVLLGDGTMGLVTFVSNEETGDYGYRMRTVDVANQAWGTEYSLPQNASSAYSGGGDYLFYYQNNDSVYGFKAGAAEGEKLFSWLDSDIDRSNISTFSFLKDGRIAALSQEWDWSEERSDLKVDLAVLTPTDRSTLPEKTTLTYATMYLGYSARNDILAFNKSSDKYRIEVQDYSEYNTESDNSAGLTKLNTEIIAGRIPDMMDTSNMPLRQYGAKGLLEDLWPFIEKDAEIGGREGVMEHVLETTEQDGKLYQVFNSFYIQTCLGAERAVGDSMSWTLADLKAALAAMPEGCTIFGDGDTKSTMLGQILAQNMDSFVAWEEGDCHFDSANFKSLLEFCNSFPDEFDWSQVDWENYQDELTRMANGVQMLNRMYLTDFFEVQIYKKVLDGGVTLVGYPMEDGSVGSSFGISTGYAMTSACKDKEGAWSFMRKMLLPRAEEAAENRAGEAMAYNVSGSAMVTRYNFGQFPMNRSDFDKMVESAMTIQYAVNEDGSQILDDDGTPIMSSQYTRWMREGGNIEVYAVTQEEVDQVMALYNAIDTTYNYDERIYDIISDMAGAYFAGDRSLDDTAAQIQSRVKLYMNEQL